MNEQWNNDLERLLADRLDGELTPEDAARLDALLAADEDARREADALGRVDALVRTHTRAVPDVDFASMRSTIMDEVGREADAHNWRRRLFRISAVAAPLAAAAVLVFALLPGRSGSPHDTADAGGGETRIALVTPEAPPQHADAKVVVAFSRPTPQRTATGGVAVTFQRSSAIEQAIAKQDEASRSRPRVAVATTSTVGFDALTAVALPPPI